jgi:transcriptional regulator with XRE-family HTH domain
MTPAVCRAARALAGITQAELARRASVSVPTVADFERGARQPQINNIKALRLALEAAGVSLIEENGETVGVRHSISAPGP